MLLLCFPSVLLLPVTLSFSQGIVITLVVIVVYVDSP